MPGDTAPSQITGATVTKTGNAQGTLEGLGTPIGGEFRSYRLRRSYVIQYCLEKSLRQSEGARRALLAERKSSNCQMPAQGGHHTTISVALTVVGGVVLGTLPPSTNLPERL